MNGHLTVNTLLKITDYNIRIMTQKINDNICGVYL